MTDTPALQPATPDELAESLAFALCYDGRKRVHHADSIIARIAAERLVRHLTRSGYVVMKRGPRPGHSASSHPHPHRG